MILSFSSEPDHLLVTTVRRCEQLGVEVSLVPRLYESINERSTLDHVGGIPLLTLHPIDPEGWQFAIKHSFDRSAALLALLLLSPLMWRSRCCQALVPGPVLFRQRRVGRDGREFDVLKFRTMKLGVPAELAFELPDGIAPGGVEGETAARGSGDGCAICRSTSCPADQRPARRHEPCRPAPGAPRLRRALRARRRSLRGPSSRQVGHHRLGAGPWPARPDLDCRPGRVGQLLHPELVTAAGLQDHAADRRRDAAPPRYHRHPADPGRGGREVPTWSRRADRRYRYIPTPPRPVHDRLRGDPRWRRTDRRRPGGSPAAGSIRAMGLRDPIDGPLEHDHP